MTENKVVNIPIGDARASTFYKEVCDFVYKKAYGLPIPTVIGVLEIIKKDIMENGDDRYLKATHSRGYVQGPA